MDRLTLPRLVVALVVATGFLGGCQSDRLQAERDGLYRQNQELANSLALAQAERDRLLQQNNQLNGDRTATQNERTAERNSPPVVFQSRVANTQANRTIFEGISGIETERTKDRITVRVPGDVLFESGKIDLRSTSLKTLDQVAAVIKREYAGNLIRVEGYTDSDPIRKSQWKDNLELSLQRAAAVHRHLQTKGLDSRRMYAAGFGPANPRPTKTQSRRVEIVVVLNERMAAK